MVSIKVSEDLLLNILMERVQYWRSDPSVVGLYEAYYQDLIDGGCFDGMEFDPALIVDNDIVNYTEAVTADEFDDYGITGEDDDRILCKYNDLFLIQTY